MKRCYIAGQIGGLSQYDYELNFHRAEMEVAELGMSPVSPLKLPHEHGKTWEEYMKEDISALLNCQCVYVLRNWRFSPGAKTEIQTAISVGIDVIFQKP